MINAGNCKLWWHEFWIIIHLGKNPRNGGKPPSDIRLIARKNLIVGDVHLKEIWLECWEDILKKIRRMVADKIE